MPRIPGYRPDPWPPQTIGDAVAYLAQRITPMQKLYLLEVPIEQIMLCYPKICATIREELCLWRPNFHLLAATGRSQPGDASLVILHFLHAHVHGGPTGPDLSHN